MKKTKDENLLGYWFGFKESTQSAPNQFTVTFKEGLSNKYPKEHKKKKDFWCQEIRVGDYSDLYADDQLLRESFEHHIREDVEGEGLEFYVNLYNQERIGYFQDTPIDLDKYLILTAMAGAHCDFSFARQIVTDDQINALLKPYGMDADLYNHYGNISERIYDDEISKFAKGIGH